MNKNIDFHVDAFETVLKLRINYKTNINVYNNYCSNVLRPGKI